MDAHTYYPSRYLAAGIERLRQGDTEWVSGPQVPQPTGSISRAVAIALGTWLGRGGSRKWREDDVTGGQERDLDTGVFGGVWHRTAVLDIGGWDERWPINQDSEMAARFLRRGARLVCIPEMAARYTPRDSLRGLSRQYFRYGLYRAQTFRRHPSSMRRSHLIAPALAGALARRGGLSQTAAPMRSGGHLALSDGRWSDRREHGSAPGAAQAEGALLTVVLPTIHLSWGFGTLIAGVSLRGPCKGFAEHARPLSRAVGPRRSAGSVRALAAWRVCVSVRLAVYTDYEYRSDGVHRYGQRAFVVFLEALRPHVDRLVLVGRLDPQPGRSHYQLHEDTELVGLPHYTSLAHPWSVIRSLFASIRRFWRLLDEVDTVWVLGPYPHSVVFALITALRGRRVVLGVRQDTRAYIRSRRPDQRWMHVAADLLEGVWGLFARRHAIVVVGQELERKYRSRA